MKKILLALAVCFLLSFAVGQAQAQCGYGGNYGSRAVYYSGYRSYAPVYRVQYAPRVYAYPTRTYYAPSYNYYPTYGSFYRGGYSGYRGSYYGGGYRGYGHW